MRTVTDVDFPYGIALLKSPQEIVVSEWNGHRLSIFDMKGQKIRTFGSHGDSPDKMVYPKGLATDNIDNIYVSSNHKLQKFTSSGELIKCIGRKGRKEGEFDEPRGVTLYYNQIYVCDSNNHRIQVFSLNFNFIQSIGSCGKEGGEFKIPYDVKFDTAGNMYVAEYGNERVQVMDTHGQFIRAFCREEGKLGRPLGLCIFDKYMCVSDYFSHSFVIYETSGKFVTSFGKFGKNEGEFYGPRSITSCANGFLYICDWHNGRVHIL